MYEANMDWDRKNKYQRLGMWVTQEQLVRVTKVSVAIIGFGLILGWFLTYYSLGFHRVCEFSNCVVTNKI